MNSKNFKRTFVAQKEMNSNLEKLSKLTGFNKAHIIREIIGVSFKNGLVKDLFWLYMKDHSDPFLNREITKGIDNTLLLKDAFLTIETIFSEQENRIRALEEKHSEIIDFVNGKLNQQKLTKFIE